MWGLLDNRAMPTRRGLSYRGLTSQAPFSPLGTPPPVGSNCEKTDKRTKSVTLKKGELA